MKDLAEGSCEDDTQDAAFLSIQLLAEHGENIAIDIDTTARIVSDIVNKGLEEPEAEESQGDPGTEEKQKILDLFLPALQATRAGEDVKLLAITDYHRIVEVHFNSSAVRKVNVDCDSGIAMIVDVCRALM